MRKKIKLNLKFDECVYRIMKQRKSRYMKKKKLKELNWEDYLQTRILINGRL